MVEEEKIRDQMIVKQSSVNKLSSINDVVLATTLIPTADSGYAMITMNVSSSAVATNISPLTPCGGVYATFISYNQSETKQFLLYPITSPNVTFNGLSCDLASVEPSIDYKYLTIMKDVDEEEIDEYLMILEDVPNYNESNEHDKIKQINILKILKEVINIFRRIFRFAVIGGAFFDIFFRNIPQIVIQLNEMMSINNEVIQRGENENENEIMQKSENENEIIQIEKDYVMIQDDNGIVQIENESEIIVVENEK
ncbi:24759_t:CDS:2 [Gigaspora margarita]|uniref:24759_t:CDS:1 n=1 Tax=Gigaspora margarita TaxID=4874 RepID=A0ABN7UAD5_GIGMA|nr:24759_t:CDS:2 [Gigaspora margarita]